MSQHSTSPGKLQFRGIRERNLEDQAQAMAAGYSSVEQYAIDQLAKMYHDFRERLERVEKHMGLTSYVEELARQKENLIESDPED